LASDAAIIPFPKDEETPPVTKIYLVVSILCSVNYCLRDANVAIY